MPKLTPEQKKIPELTAALALKDKKIGTTRSPYFAQFEHGWPIRDITRIYCQTSRRAKAETRRPKRAHTLGAQPTTTQPSTTAKTVKKKKAVVFIDTDDADASDEEDEPLSKKKPLPKKKAVKTVRSATEEDSDKEDDADQNVDADYDDDNCSSTDPQSLPIKTPNQPQNDKNKENKPPVRKKRKAEELPALAGSPAKKAVQAPYLREKWPPYKIAASLNGHYICPPVSPDDPTTTPTRMIPVDLQPGIHSVSPLRQRPMYFPFSTSGDPCHHPGQLICYVGPQLDHPHYDVVISPSEKTLPARMSTDFIRRLQFDVAPADVKFDTGSQEFDVTLADEAPQENQVTHVVSIPSSRAKGLTTHGPPAITALNVIRMQPKLSTRQRPPFFTDHETKGIGSGLELWPTSSPLPRIYGQEPPERVSRPPTVIPDRKQLRLQRFSCGIRILTTHCGPDGKKHTTLCAFKKLSTAPANKLTFTMREGQSVTIADYFQRTQNKPLQFSDVIWAEVGSGALILLELCDVPPE
ncbi:hypothetical protein B0H14DRAFT_3469986 [Mycena olivaceomarginata]|nr:hypothetical protein B0H14DRAFT_3469986 [Mycena olivaceomarginata]